MNTIKIKKLFQTFLLIGFFIFISCEKFYSKIYDEKIQEKIIDCINLEESDLKMAELIKISLLKEGINVKQDCPFSLKVNYRLLSQCNSLTGRSIGADFDGFLRFDIFNRKKLVYRCQMDWKGDFGKEKIRKLIKLMKEDLKFKRN